MQVNVWAPWELMRDVIGPMRERGSGSILNLTTFAAELPPGPPFPTNKPGKAGFQYGASKAALNRLTVAAASECEGQGISVNALAPQAAIATPALVEAGWIEAPQPPRFCSLPMPLRPPVLPMVLSNTARRPALEASNLVGPKVL